MTEAEMIAALADGQRRGTHTVDAGPFGTLDRDAAYRVQSGVLEAIGAPIGMLKTAIHSDGVGVAAPIYAGSVGRNAFALPAAKAQYPGLPLRAGTIITAGSLCGLVLTSGSEHVMPRLGDDTVEFDLV